jgi:hypothetical protein
MKFVGKLVSGEISLSDPAGQGEENSVYDFLYHDARRVASFLAQLNPSGHVQAVKRSTESSSSTQHEGGLNATASALVAKATLDYALHNTRSSRDNLELTIDPTWTNAVDLLNLLADRGCIIPDLVNAGSGAIVVVTGRVLLIDTEYAKPALSTTDIKAHVLSSIAQKMVEERQGLKLYGDKDFNQLAGTPRKKRAERDARLTLELLHGLPRTVHMRVRTDPGDLVFCSIRPENLVVPVTDLLMTHGPILQGKWAVLGIYDARPDKHAIDIEKIADEFSINGAQLLKSAVGYGPMLRQVGRTDEMHAVTPLLIFRKVGSA